MSSRDYTTPLTSPNNAKCREKSAELRREMDAFLNSGGEIRHLESFLTSNKPPKKHETSRQRGMKKFNGGIAK